MDFLISIGERFFSVVEWGVRSGGWWFVVGSVSAVLILCLGIHRAPNR